MILGIGIDLLDKRRVERLFYKFNKKVTTKILSVDENSIFSALGSDCKKINFLAKRFSAKESLLKAIGIGMGRGILMKNISVLNDDFGKPYIEFDDVTKNFIGSFYKLDEKNIDFNISITDEKNLINTIIIISKKNV
jgi:holo-[acyl-carrier protein] synthase